MFACRLNLVNQHTWIGVQEPLYLEWLKYQDQNLHLLLTGDPEISVQGMIYPVHDSALSKVLLRMGKLGFLHLRLTERPGKKK